MSSSRIRMVLVAIASICAVMSSLSAKAESCSSLRSKYNHTVAKAEQYTSMGNMTLAKRFLDQAQYYASEMKRTSCK